MIKFTFYDIETAWDDDLHAAYCSIERRVKARVRMASRRVFAAAAFDVTLHSDGAICFERMASWTEYTHGDEQAVVRGLFDHLRAVPDNIATAYGSVAMDLPILTLAAMEHGLPLPTQLLLRKHAPKRGAIRPHLDLGLQLKATGKSWTHLSEVLIRLGLPTTLMQGKKRVEFPTDPAGWAAARAHCELDTALLAIATMAWQRSQGQCSLDPRIASLVILDWLRRNRPLTPAMQDRLAAICAAMSGQLANQLMPAA